MRTKKKVPETAGRVGEKSWPGRDARLEKTKHKQGEEAGLSRKRAPGCCLDTSAPYLRTASTPGKNRSPCASSAGSQRRSSKPQNQVRQIRESLCSRTQLRSRPATRPRSPGQRGLRRSTSDCVFPEC